MGKEKFHLRKTLFKKKIEKNNLAIALNALYAKHEKNISCLRSKI